MSIHKKFFFKAIEISEVCSYAVPSGMTKLRLSANSPHATRFVWKIVIQTPSPMAHIRAKIADSITSKMQTLRGK